MQQKGFSQLLIIVGVLFLIAWTGFLFWNSNRLSSERFSQTIPRITPSPSPSVYPRDFISSNKSPSGKYTIKEEQIGDTQYIVLSDDSGNIISENIVDDEGIGYNTKFQCQCGTKFKEWINDDYFKIKIINGGGEEYEYTVDTATGKVDPNSFKKIQ